MVSVETLEFIAATTVPQYHLSNYGLNTVIHKGERELIVAGYASPQVIDREKHLITKEALKNDLPRFMANPRYRNVNLLHSNVQVGEVIPEWTNAKTGETWRTKVDDIGLFAVIKVRTDPSRPEIMDRVEEDILAGKLASFSISADAPFDSRRHECVNGTCFWVIDRIQLYEITICETPVNQNAKFAIISKALGSAPNPAEFMSSAYCLDGSCPLTSAQVVKAGGIVVPPMPTLDIVPESDTGIGSEMGGAKFDDGAVTTPAKPNSPTPSPAAEEIKEIDEVDEIPAITKTHSRNRCMECKKPPTKDVIWAEGMARAWFCDEHFEEWSADNGDDIVSVKPVKGGGMVRKHMGGSFGSDMANTHYMDIDYDEKREGAFDDIEKAATGMADPGMSPEAAKYRVEEEEVRPSLLREDLSSLTGDARALNLSNDNYYAIFASTAKAMADALNLYLMDEEDEMISRAILAAIQTGDIDYISKADSSEWIAWVPNGFGLNRSFVNINRHVEKLLKKNVTTTLLLSHDTLTTFRPLVGQTAIRALESSLTKMSDAMSHQLPSDVKGALRTTLNLTMSLISGYDPKVSKAVQVNSKIMASKDALSQAVLALEEKVMNTFVRDNLDNETVASLDAAYEGIRNAIDGIALGDMIHLPEEPEFDIISESGAETTLDEVGQADKILESLDKSLRKATDDTTPHNIAYEMANNIGTERESASFRRPPEVIDTTSLPDANPVASEEASQRFGPTIDSIHNDPSHTRLEDALSKAGSPDSAMIAWFLPPELAQQIAIPGGEAPKDMHCTIALLPKGMGEPQLKAVAELVRKIASTSQPLTGILNGFGKFNPGEPGGLDPWYAVVDVPGLSAFRAAVVDGLKKAGIKVMENHDYSPHVTLLYGTPKEIPHVDNHEITIDNLVIAYGGSEGGRLEPIPMGGAVAEPSRNKALNLSTTDHDVISYGRVFDSMWRKGIQDPRFSLAVKAEREDGRVEYLDLGDD